jgi:hypothetical protein
MDLFNRTREMPEESSNNRKRKRDERVLLLDKYGRGGGYKDCDEVRAMIADYVGAGEDVVDFYIYAETSKSNTLAFLRQEGPMGGWEIDTYLGALEFFWERELREAERKRKEPMTTASKFSVHWRHPRG